MSDGTQNLRGRARALSAVLTTAIAALAAFAVPGALAAPGQGFLPDNRAWELVSPPEKNGGDVVSEAGRTRVATSGDAATFGSLRAFAGAKGTGIGVLYMSKRDGAPGTNGWSAHSLFPPLDPLSANAVAFGQDTTYPGELSDDLSRGVLRTLTPLTDAPMVDNVVKLYLRDDLLDPDGDSYALLSDCPGCGSPLADDFGQYVPALAGHSEDFGHVVFEAKRQLTADAPAPGFFCAALGLECKPTLYEWDHGTLRVAAVLPDDSIAPISIAGQNLGKKRFTTNMVSDDGSKIFFVVPSEPAGVTGDLYMRVDHEATVQINASERDPVDPAGPLPARYETATPDGSTVFFTTVEQLVDVDTDGESDLYAYDTTIPDTEPNLTLVSVDGQPGDGDGDVVGVIGASDDGSDVYFGAAGQLDPNGPLLPGNTGLYHWEDGDITYIGLQAEDFSSNFFGTDTNHNTITSRVTPDGEHLLFRSLSGDGLTGDDHGICGAGAQRCFQYYLYEKATDTLVCATCNRSGDPAGADAVTNVTPGSVSGGSTQSNRPLSDDGTRVFFETGERLVPEDRNGAKVDVYVYDVPSGEHHLISSGKSSDDSHFLNASPSGDDVFFTTTERLLGWDRDNAYDLYDARVGGGFPEPAPTPAECAGIGCQGSPQANPPAEAAVSSARVAASGNVAARAGSLKRCATGKRKVRRNGKARCVKRKNRANTDRRATR